jgi:hypothetical protein
MSAYPRPFDPADFPAIPEMVAPRPKEVAQELRARAPVYAQSALRVPGKPDAFVTKLWIQDPGGLQTQSQSFQNKDESANAPVDSGRHFHFIPGLDDVEMRWTVAHPEKLVRASFEIWASGITNAPIWTKQVQAEAAVQLIDGTDGKSSGTLPWSQVVIGGDAQRFPDSVPNVAFAPYQVRLTVESENGMITTAWTYFDVLVHSIELHWGPEAWIPGTPIPNVSPMLQARTTADEKRVLQLLKGKVRPTDPEVTAIAPATAPLIPLRLRSTMAAYIHFDEWFGFAKDFAFLRHRARWGDGPRIPIMAKIYLKRTDGTKLDPDVGGATWNQAGAALGPARLLWDWHDRSQADRTLDEQRLWTEAGNFVLRALNYKLNAGDEPPDCRNCHFERGGKRGGPDRIFPDQTGTATLPFVVAQCTDRKWAALSTPATQGANACRTGVLFNPSRMAKDSYQITVVLANQLTADRSKPMLDVTTRIDLLLQQNPGLPTAATPTLEVMRQVNARYIRKHTYAPIDLNLISTSYEVAGVYIEWLNNVDPTFNGLWDQAEFAQYLQDAIAMAGQHFSDQQIHGRRFTAPNGRYAVRTNRYSQIQALAARGLLGQYNHWFGCSTATHPLPAQPSEVCFTFPSRDKVVADYRDQAIAAYIAKPRKINSVLRKWNQLRNQQPAATHPALRIQLYNWLSASQKRKVDAETQRLYTSAGWQDFNQVNPNKWAATNYQHTGGPVDLLAEMHQLKVAADAYEGVTFFHYINILNTVDAAGNEPPASAGIPTGRYYDLGGVAKVDTSFDLGLKSIFFVWDHPTDGRRGLSKTPSIPMMNGNVTAVHEFGHNLHLTHPFGSDGAWNRDMHDKNPAERPSEDDAPGPADRCVMNYHRQDVELCGVCRLRLRGWALFKNPPLEGFDVTDPGLAGRPLRNSGQPILNGFFTDLG